MTIVFDAIGYERLGEMIYKKGWIEFFRTGPNREPLYPLSIAVSMSIADILNTSYQKIQTIFQILILFIVQILALKIITMCSFKKWVKLLAVFYLGFSPAIVNAGFSLFSEILAMPFVLLVVIFSGRFLEAVQIKGYKQVALASVCLSIAFIGAISVKAIFQYVFFVFIMIFFISAVGALLRGRKDVMIKVILGVLIMALGVGSFVNGYKSLNKIYNGKFDFTDRYDYLLFGTAYKRVQPLSRDVWLAHFVSIPGNNFCESIINKEACLYPQFHQGDAIWPVVLPSLLADIPNEGIFSEMIQLSFDQIKKNPIQYSFLTFLESLKMFFWESTQIGFVNYPKPHEQFFSNKLFKNSIRLVMALLTFAGFFLMVFEIIKSRRKLLDFNVIDSPTFTLFFLICVVSLFVGLYSIFAILSRFALPIAPLYVICIAYFLNEIAHQKFIRMGLMK